MGSTSAQSFQQRKAIEQNRQHVGSYRDAGVLRAYRQNAQRAVADTVSDQQKADEVTAASAQDPRHARSRTIPRTSRIEHRATSRIDIVKAPGRRDLPVTSVARPAQTPGFREPQGRPYNPYS